MDVAGMSMEKQFECYTGTTSVWLQVVAAMQTASLHRLRDEWREARFASGVAERGVELVRIHKFGCAEATPVAQPSAILRDHRQAMLLIDLVYLLQEFRFKGIA